MHIANTKIKTIMKVRKSIDLDADTKTALSHQAIEKGMNLKQYIEDVLRRIAEAKEDEILISLASVDEGIITGQEKQNFINYINSL